MNHDLHTGRPERRPVGTIAFPDGADFAPEMTPAQVGAYSTLALAHIGDGVYELMMRTALCAAGLTAVVDKASAGAAEHMLVSRVTNIPAALGELKKKGLWVYGTAADAPADLWQTKMTGPAALVIGSEGFGMGRLVSEQCDFTVGIPLLGKITSLNASAAAAILMYEVVRQRRDS